MGFKMEADAARQLAALGLDDAVQFCGDSRGED
jgi:hypothetical protein